MSNLTIKHSVIERNNDTGLACLSGSTLELTNSVIRFNGSCGIYLRDMFSATIKNNWIHNNGTGIYIDNYYGAQTPATIRNNTIVNDANYGIYRDSSAPEPNISNCIIWNNNNDANQLYGCSASYSCIQNGTTDNNNINTAPNFMNPTDPNDFHLGPTSPCIDTGDPNADYNGETDIDSEERVKYGRVDIGADEYYLSPADFNDDLIVNFLDYAIFAYAWMSQPDDPNWNPKCDIGIPDNNHIDYADLAILCEDWLWQAGWTKTFTCGAGQGMSQTMTAGFGIAETAYPSILAEQQAEKIEPIEIEQIIKWLEQLWLDEEVQKLINEDVWLKFIESLKEEL